MPRILVLHGPNLNALGSREPAVYGHTSLDDIHRSLESLAAELGCAIEWLQSNHEGVLLDALYGARERGFGGALLNPGGLTHTSVALRDAVLASGLPVIEVHVSNPHAREAFRHVSLISGAALGVVQGFGANSYRLALRAMADHLAHARP
ncbi:MAG: type II 3-dehydroquinate dehydratase [Candidatus Eisenbacteria bacterium]|nr:type II 3-dehydroquinate dehydratase [Candidatus Eisenbacteria bacterium]